MESQLQLERRLGYRFTDGALLALALTHRSSSEVNNERLEFLGDAALGCIIAEWLCEVFPDAREHSLTLMRASLVKRSTLSRVAREISLVEQLRLGIGELRSGGRQRESILADTLEAILGAALQDGGLEVVKRIVRKLFAEHVAQVDAGMARDSKTHLQETVQARRLPPPDYRVIARSGDEHLPEFLVECRIEGLRIVTQGQGGSRREAEQVAARAALDLLGDADDA
ncbi:MAG: ribonuclease III [Proteobacteria bacterium]|nr:ribonuclease III [Pseudomonadota bacterium]